MATLYVENIPKDLYEALRRRARENRKSIAAEVLSLLERHIPTAAELKKRRQMYERLKKIRSYTPPGPGPFQSSEEMQREDRER
jgi:plasmid stability protein